VPIGRATLAVEILGAAAGAGTALGLVALLAG
jgi:hypothetical protein